MVADGARPRILVVHDVREVLRGFREALEPSGYRVATAGDEEAALEAARRGPPDLIILSLPVSPLDAMNRGVALRKRAGLDERVPLVVIPAVRTPLEAVDVPVGDNVYLTFLSDFGQMEKLLAHLLSA